jgi:hypothetical protein
MDYAFQATVDLSRRQPALPLALETPPITKDAAIIFDLVNL